MSRKGSFDEPTMISDINPNVGSMRRQMSAVEGSPKFASRKLAHQSSLMMTSALKPNTMSMFESTRKMAGTESLTMSAPRMHNMSIMNVSSFIYTWLCSI